MSADIDALSKSAYDHGTDPIDWACTWATQLMDVYEMVQGARALDPATFPGYVGDVTTVAFGRQIVGHLLDAGWTPPVLERKTPPAEDVAS